jgi:hypothetical protein
MSKGVFPEWENLAGGWLLEEFGDSFLRIAFNDQSLLLWPRFTLSALRLLLFGHLVLLSHRFSLGVKVIPQPGIEPGRPNWALGCKPSLTANSSTGGCKEALNAGAVTPCKVPPVPALFGPISAALKPSSSENPPKKSSERNVLVGNWRGLPRESYSSLFLLAVNFSRLNRATENFVDRSHRRCKARHVVIQLMKSLANILRGHFLGSHEQYLPYSVSKPQAGDAVGIDKNISQWSEMFENLVEVIYSIANIGQLCFQFRAPINLIFPLRAEFGVGLREVGGVHK